ncbi:molybdenum cofactor biosynthesis protein MoaE [Qipengyuania nanhaisediminis]|uniref:molybdenum cofactor biosynthesis protein MoaE n=1 Tax=Qipengyuania nanhaisediminis TaxID=604088 RepID=UPI0038B3252C
MFETRLCDVPFDPARSLAALAKACPDAGGIASFVGQVRAQDDGDSAVDALELSHYEPLTLPGMEALSASARARFGLSGLVLIHRVGRMAPGDPIVCIAAAARHRRAAFDASEYCIDHLKGAAWLWKRELRAGTWRWIAPRAQDHADLARWSDKSIGV